MDEHLKVRGATRIPPGSLSVLASSDTAAIRTEVFHFATLGANDFCDVTEMARGVLARSEVRHGQVTVYSPHTTTTVVINEAETGFLNDYRRHIEELAPTDAYYEHDDWDIRTENLQEDELVNGQAHVRQLLVGGASVTVPVVDGELLLGRWQRVLFVELDQARDRRVIFHAQGA